MNDESVVYNNVAVGQTKQPGIIERMERSEGSHARHNQVLDSFSGRLRRIENALGLSPILDVACDVAKVAPIVY